MTLFIFVAMQLVNRSEIDVKKWDQLVDNTAGVGFFSYSWYLDHIAENWAAIVDDDYTKGIAVPFTVRMGVKVAYTPIFVSYVEWLGEDAVDQDKLLSILRISFSGFYLAVNKQLFNIEFEKYVCQMITKEKDYTINSQAKRMLKKSNRLGYTIQVGGDFLNVFKIIEAELKGKFTGMTNESLSRLKDVLSAAQKQNRLITFEVKHGKETVGGVLCLEKKDQLLYLKGASMELAKKNGAMYFAIHAAIEYARWKKIVFDFGGSRVEGVRRFNHNLGGEDVFYYHFFEDNTPLWFRMLKRLKKVLQKHS